MIEDDERYSRQIDLFGREGQARIRSTRVCLIGLGGLGSHFAQQFAYLGIENYTLIDGDTASSHSLNRVVTATPDDIGVHKTDLAERLILAVKPTAVVKNIQHHLHEIDALAELRHVDLIVGGLDNDFARLKLIEVASALGVVYLDAATDVRADAGGLVYGGRVLISGLTPGCLFCLNLLDQQEIRHATMTHAEKQAEAAMYGVPVESLDVGTGPSVVGLNGVIASLAVNEAMAHMTGLRAPQKQLIYRGDEGGVRINRDQADRPCPYCSRWATLGDRLH